MRPEQKPRFENCWIQGVRWGRAAGAKIQPGSQLGTVMCHFHLVKGTLHVQLFPGSLGEDPDVSPGSGVISASQALRYPLFLFPPAVIPLLLVLQSGFSTFPSQIWALSAGE